MGRQIGAFDNNDELDRSDLNKCPDCGCFFGSDVCPLCGKTCPEEMRAGNRPAVKKSKKRSNDGSGRVTFIEWYHSWWFILIMMFVFPIVGIVLLATSPYSKKKKIIFISIAVLYLIVSTVGLGNIISKITNFFDKPVDTSLSRDEYIAACETVNAEDFYRSAEKYNDKFVSVTVKIVDKAFYVDKYYNESEDTYYICEAVDGSSFSIIVRDCLIDSQQKLILGDVITLYGEGDKDRTVYSEASYEEVKAPCINMAYVIIKE